MVNLLVKYVICGGHQDRMYRTLRPKLIDLFQLHKRTEPTDQCSFVVITVHWSRVLAMLI